MEETLHLREFMTLNDIFFHLIYWWYVLGSTGLNSAFRVFKNWPGYKKCKLILSCWLENYDYWRYFVSNFPVVAWSRLHRTQYCVLSFEDSLRTIVQGCFTCIIFKGTPLQNPPLVYSPVLLIVKKNPSSQNLVLRWILV